MAEYVDPTEIDPNQIVFVTRADLDPVEMFIPKPPTSRGFNSERAALIGAGLAAGKYADVETEVRQEARGLAEEVASNAVAKLERIRKVIDNERLAFSTTVRRIKRILDS